MFFNSNSYGFKHLESDQNLWISTVLFKFRYGRRIYKNLRFGPNGDPKTFVSNFIAVTESEK